MKTFTPDELKVVLDKHGKWLRSERNGERANLSYANLSYADLRSANLRYADLSCADLSSADFRYANLRYADLSCANLRYADFRSADLSSADLSCANLRDLGLWGVVGNMGVIRSIQLETYAISYTFEMLQIGCERHSIEEWRGFDDQRIIEMDGKEALKFWRKWKGIIMQLIEMSPADKWEYKAETKD